MSRFLLLAGLMFLSLAPAPQKGKTVLTEARYYRKLENKMVQCQLCPRRCLIAPGKRGFCRVRENRNGTLYSLVYGKPCSINREPIEKAPFFHFLPGAQRLTLATVGCNQRCKYCQNWEISQATPEAVPSQELTPEEVVSLAEKLQLPIICFTYTEPIVFFEYMMDIARLARARGIKTAVVSGGYINPEPLRELCSMVDAVKIDLKGFTPDFYRTVCGSTLEPVLTAIKTVAQTSCHLELVNLVVPGFNDDTATIRQMCSWIKENCGDTIPLHFTQFHPDYQLQNAPVTPVKTLERAIAIARQTGLKFVYIGNVPGHQDENTYCPECHRLLIRRQGYTVIENRIVNGKCPFCNTRISGVWR
ncbi:MAG: AmmeMemoRadiSam system radical SAM enzyme [candidate division WOR-3 bacterium]|jgi:pyruvate formate lyase activating enzyme|nr:AmmeMemoRadiSam system radical SAM enzyme [candidate division WOR-3 bacterium]MDH7519517.1 AmmeMemoRadiSam system radical SAM enzyme [bacterium]